MPASSQALSAAGRGVVQLGAARQELVLAREIRAAGLVAGTPAAGIAAEIWAQCGPEFGTTRIRACRLGLGIALADVVAQVRAWYEAESRRAPRFSETLLSAYESGQKRPGPEYLHYLCAVYRADPADLGYEGQCLCGRGHRPEARPVLKVPTGPVALPAPEALLTPEALPAPGVLSAPGTPGEPPWPRPGADEDEVRRMALALGADPGAPADSRFLGAADRIRRRMDEVLLGATVSAAMIDQLEEAAAAHGRDYPATAPARLLCDVLLDLGDVRRICAERQPVDFAQRLCWLAGQLAGLGGMIMLNLGDQRQARSFFRTAKTAADETGDRRLRAWVAAREALVPLYYGDPREALGLASTAVDLAGRHQCAAAVLGQAVAARAVARLGRGRREALNRIRAGFDRAHEALADLPATERAGAAFGYTERQLFFHEGDALAQVGDVQAAARALAHASRLYPDAEFLDRALVGLGRARCLLDAAEPEEALRLAAATLAGLAPGQRAAIITRAARDLAAGAADRYPGLPALAGYREVLAAG